jgi:8-oxo-dGTP diphosphatase
MNPSNQEASLKAGVDWAHWVPRERATLVFVVRDGQILLIEKKRGLGAGKVNGPGGRLDPGESPVQCATRECQEELGITPTGLTHAGTLAFQFVGHNKLGGHSIHVDVYRADGFTGEITETDEARGFWCGVGQVPYARMWQDDQYWLPQLIEGQRFTGRFVFEEELMLWMSVQPADESPNRGASGSA